jgi:hypothetical protein
MGVGVPPSSNATAGVTRRRVVSQLAHDTRRHA